MKKWIGIALTTSLLTACVTTPGGVVSVSPLAERPVFDMPAANELQNAAKIHVELGMAYLQISRYDVALDEAKIAMAYDSRYAPAYHLKGLVFLYLEDMAAAAAQFNEAIRLAPHDPEINNSYGWFQCLRDNFEDGIARLTLAGRNPYYRTPTRAYTNAGLCELRRNDQAAALAHFLRATELDSSNAQALFHVAEISFGKHDYALARQELIRFHRISEPTAESLWLGLRAENRLGNSEGVETYSVQLRNRYPDSAQARLMMQGNFE